MIAVEMEWEAGRAEQIKGTKQVCTHTQQHVYECGCLDKPQIAVTAKVIIETTFPKIF